MKISILLFTWAFFLCSFGFGSPRTTEKNECAIYHIDGGYFPSSKLGTVQTRPTPGVYWYTPAFSTEELRENRKRALRLAQAVLRYWIRGGSCPKSTSLIPICEPNYADLCTN